MIHQVPSMFSGRRCPAGSSGYPRKDNQAGERSVGSDLEFHELVIKTDRTSGDNAQHSDRSRSFVQKPHSIHMTSGKNMSELSMVNREIGI